MFGSEPRRRGGAIGPASDHPGDRGARRAGLTKKAKCDRPDPFAFASALDGHSSEWYTVPAMDNLTNIQREVLELLRRHADLGDAPPSYRDLCKEFGWSSTGTARDHLRALARKGYIELSGGRARLVRLVEMPPVARVPLIGHVVAGSPVSAEEFVEGRVPVPAAWIGCGSAFALRVHGDSMVGAGILDGDTVIIRKQSAARDGDVVAATVGGETTLKRLKRRAGRTSLAAENANYPDIEVGDDDLLVHGVLIGLLRQVVRDIRGEATRRTMHAGAVGDSIHETARTTSDDA